MSVIVADMKVMILPDLGAWSERLGRNEARRNGLTKTNRSLAVRYGSTAVATSTEIPGGFAFLNLVRSSHPFALIGGSAQRLRG